MRVAVRLFATYREVVGRPDLAMELEPGATLADALAALFADHPRLERFEDTMILAVNHEFAEVSTPLREGDEVALMPPVSGGAPVVGVQEEPIDLGRLVDSVRSPKAGAVVAFLGTVRADPGVEALDYEVYREMAVKKMRELVAAAKKTFGLVEMSMVHRLGRIEIGGDSVVVACSAAHRREAFEACEWAMSELKKVVPIWKAEG